MGVVVGWRGTPADAPHLAAIQDEILRAALADTSIEVCTIGYPGDATDPLWRLDARWRIGAPGSITRFDVLLAPIARPPADGDAMARTALGAMREGIPVIATARWPMRALIVDGATGILIPEGRGREWNRAILRLAGDEALRAQMGTAAARAAAGLTDSRGRHGR